MNNTPQLQHKLYGLTKYFCELVQIFEANKLSNRILLTGPKGTGKSTLIYHFINYIFSKDEDYKYKFHENTICLDNKSFKLIKNQSHPNFYLIDIMNEKKNIEISQIREMFNYTNKSSFNSKPKFVFIDNVENLNINSLNALLKIIEEPNEGLYFLLSHNSRKNLKDTIRSRCLNFKINLKFNQSVDIANSIINGNIFDYINYDLISYYNTPGEIINVIKFSKDNNIDLKKITLKSFLLLLINDSYYKKNNFIKTYIYSFIQLYFLNLQSESNSNNNINLFYNKFNTMAHNCNKFNLNNENLFMEFKTKFLNG